MFYLAFFFLMDMDRHVIKPCIASQTTYSALCIVARKPFHQRQILVQRERNDASDGARAGKQAFGLCSCQMEHGSMERSGGGDKVHTREEDVPGSWRCSVLINRDGGHGGEGALSSDGAGDAWKCSCSEATSHLPPFIIRCGTKLLAGTGWQRLVLVSRYREPRPLSPQLCVCPCLRVPSAFLLPLRPRAIAPGDILSRRTKTKHSPPAPKPLSTQRHLPDRTSMAY